MKLSDLPMIYCAKGWRLSTGFGANLTPSESAFITDGRTCLLADCVAGKVPAKTDREHRIFKDPNRDRVIREVWEEGIAGAMQDFAHVESCGIITGGTRKKPTESPGVLIRCGDRSEVFDVYRICAAMRLTFADGIRLPKLNAVTTRGDQRHPAVLYRGLHPVGMVCAVRPDAYTPNGAGVADAIELVGNDARAEEAAAEREELQAAYSARDAAKLAPTPAELAERVAAARAAILQAGTDSGRVVVATVGRPPAPVAPKGAEPEDVPDFVPEGSREPFTVKTGASRKGRQWVALCPRTLMTDEDFAAVFAKVKGIGGWWSRAWDGKPGGFAVWAEDRARLAGILGA